MSGRGAGVGVVVVAVGKVGAMVEQQAEPAFAPLVAIALQIVAAKLVDHDDDNKLGTCVISGTEARAGEAETEQKWPGSKSGERIHCGVVYSLGGAGPNGTTCEASRLAVQSSKARPCCRLQTECETLLRRTAAAAVHVVRACPAAMAHVHSSPLFRYSSELPCLISILFATTCPWSKRSCASAAWIRPRC